MTRHTAVAGIGAVLVVGGLLFGASTVRTADPLPSPIVVASPVIASPEPPVSACTVTIQHLVDAATAGGQVVVPRCLARETVVISKPLTLRGSPGSEIRGSDAWTSWTPSGGDWRSARAIPTLPGGGTCRSGQGCQNPEQVSIDGVPAVRVRADPAAGEFAVDQKRRVILGGDPAGHLVEVTVRDAWVVIAAPDVTVTGFSMRDAANLPQTGAIRNLAGAGNDVVTGNVLAYAHGADVALDFGNHNVISDNDIGFGGQLGIHLGGDGTPSDGHGNVVRGNRIHDNNIAGFDPEWEAGGLKATVQTDLLIEDNEVEDNAGPGLWCDIYCRRTVYRANLVHDNSYAGIMEEVSYNGLITGNAVWNNGYGKASWGWGAGILVSSSTGTEVSNNTLAWNARSGVSIISQNRRDWPDVKLPTGIYVHDNVTAVSVPNTYGEFWGEDFGGSLFSADQNNHGSNNRFWFAFPEAGNWRFAWNGNFGALADFARTPAGPGDSYLTDAQKDTILAAAGVPAAP